MKYVITINQEKLVKLAPKGVGLADGAVLDFIHWFCASTSPAIEQMRMLHPDGTRYTWIDYEYAIAELPLLGSTSRQTICRVIARLEKWGFIRCWSPDHRRKYVVPTPKMDVLFHRPGDIPVHKLGRKAKLFPKWNRAVPQMEQSLGGSCSPNVTYQDIRDQDIKDPVRNNKLFTGPESIKTILRRRIKTV